MLRSTVVQNARFLSQAPKSTVAPASLVTLTPAERNYLKHTPKSVASLDKLKHDPLRYLANVKPKPVPRDVNYYSHRVLLRMGDLIGRHGEGKNRRSNIVIISVAAVLLIDVYLLANWWYGETLQVVTDDYAEQAIARSKQKSWWQ